MAYTLVDADLQALLDYLSARSTANWELGLYKSNTTPTRSTVIGDLTECDFSGYARIALNDFGAATLAGNIASAVSAAEVFSHSGGATANTVYGYFVYDTSSAKLVGAEKFAASKSMAVSGDTITITPTHTFRQNGV